MDTSRRQMVCNQKHTWMLLQSKPCILPLYEELPWKPFILEKQINKKQEKESLGLTKEFHYLWLSCASTSI